MTWRVYFVPMELDAKGDRVPKYLGTDLSGLSFNLMDYGNEPTALLSVDVTEAQHVDFSAHNDVVAFPTNFDQTIGGQAGAMQSALGTLNVPEDWIQSTFTYRQILRVVSTVFLFMQRVQVSHALPIFRSGVTLSTRFNQLPADVRQALQAAAASLGMDTAMLTGSMTLRQMLKLCADSAHVFEIILGAEEV